MSNDGFLRRLTHRFTDRTPVVPVLRLSGPIGAAGSFGRGLSLAGLAGSIERAFAVSKAPAVALTINSPGGAPVQAALIARRIRELAVEKGQARHCIRRGRCGVRRLLARLRRRRDLRRREFRRGIDRRDQRRLRLRPAVGADRDRAARPYGGDAQGHARSLRRGEGGGRRDPQEPAGRRPRRIHHLCPGTSRRRSEEWRKVALRRRVLDRPPGSRSRPRRRHRPFAHGVARPLSASGCGSGSSRRPGAGVGAFAWSVAWSPTEKRRAPSWTPSANG